MGLRDAINQHPTAVGVGIVVLLALLLFFTFPGLRGGGSSHGVEGFWFYDTGTDQFYIAPTHTQGPVTAPSGEEGVRAMIYTCASSCGAPDLDGKKPEDLEAMNLHVGWYRKLTPEGAKVIEGKQTRIDPMMLRRYQMIRFPGDEKWHAESQVSARRDKALRRLCPNAEPIGCLPGVE